MEQEKQTDLETRIQNLRAEGKTYRKIAEKEHVSIAQISIILNKHGKEEMTSSQQEDFERQVFKLLNKGLPPNRIIAKLGKTSKVLELFEVHKKLMKEDFSLALSKIREYGFYESGSCPLTDALGRIFEAYFELQNKLKELDGEIKALRWVGTKKDETIATLKTENAKLQKFNQFKTITSNEIERRKATVRARSLPSLWLIFQLLKNTSCCRFHKQGTVFG